MNLVEVMERFPDQQSCIDHLERIRWRDKAYCPKCGSVVSVVRKKEDGIGRVGRWHCHDCGASFKVTCGTVFHGTKIPLQKWLIFIRMVLNLIVINRNKVYRHENAFLLCRFCLTFIA